MTKLSICIGTYNRSDFIGETLDCFIPQLTEDTELLVVDGASTDNTEEVMCKYLEQTERIRYVRLPVKGGVDYDYNQAVELARGEYCWLFTDDDMIKAGTIKAILNQINNEYDLVIVNAEVCNPDFSKILEERRLQILKNISYKQNDFEKFFTDNANYMSYIGSVVIKRSVWLERKKEKYFGSEFVHLGVIFQKQFESPISVIAFPYISIRFGNEQWSRRAFEIWMFKWPKLLWSFDCFSDTAKSMLSLEEPWRNLTKLLHQRAEGKFSSVEYNQFIKPRISSFSEKAIIRTITLIPGCLLNFLALTYCTVKSSISQLSVFNLKNSKYYYLNTVKQKRVSKKQ